MLTAAFLSGPFADSAWRRERGALLDVGPHVFDLLDAALGPVERISARATARGWVGIHIDHQNGAGSDVTMSCEVGVEAGRFDVELYGPEGSLTFTVGTGDADDLHATIRSEFTQVTRGNVHPCDVHRGLYIQQLVDAAERSLDAGPVSLVPPTR